MHGHCTQDLQHSALKQNCGATDMWLNSPAVDCCCQLWMCMHLATCQMTIFFDSFNPEYVIIIF